MYSVAKIPEGQESFVSTLKVFELNGVCDQGWHSEKEYGGHRAMSDLRVLVHPSTKSTCGHTDVLRCTLCTKELIG